MWGLICTVCSINIQVPASVNNALEVLRVTAPMFFVDLPFMLGKFLINKAIAPGSSLWHIK